MRNDDIYIHIILIFEKIETEVYQELCNNIHINYIYFLFQKINN